MTQPYEPGRYIEHSIGTLTHATLTRVKFSQESRSINNTTHNEGEPDSLGRETENFKNFPYEAKMV